MQHSGDPVSGTERLESRHPDNPPWPKLPIVHSFSFRVYGLGDIMQHQWERRGSCDFSRDERVVIVARGAFVVAIG